MIKLVSSNLTFNVLGSIGMIIIVVYFTKIAIKHQRKMRASAIAEPSPWVDRNRNKKYHRDVRNASAFVAVMDILLLVLKWGTYLEGL